MERIILFIKQFIETNYVTDIRFFDLLEIALIAMFLYHVMLWIQNTKAWMLLRGILVIGIFILIAVIFNMQTILYLAKNAVNVLAIAAIVVFQPEIRRALENLGQKNILQALAPFDKKKDNIKFHKKSLSDLVDACIRMSNDKTGALIVIEKDVRLTEFSDTGIEMDCKISSEIICNIFEHNTPLHDGAIILRDDRIVASTCYLPLSDNMNLSKHLGTRHRAAIGVSEVSDALILIVSEETGAISIAENGKIFSKVNKEMMEEKLALFENVEVEETDRSLFTRFKGGDKNEKNTPQ